MRKVILSSTLLLEEGTFSMRKVDLAEAADFARDAELFCSHETVRILGINPDTARKVCGGYDEALVIKPHNRLEYRREYTLAEIEEIGYDLFIIKKEEK